MTVVQPMIEPDRDAIKAHLDSLFMGAQREYPGGLVELRYGPPEHLDNWSYFNIQEDGLAEAANFAASRNREGQNVYVGVNPRKPNTSGKRAGTAGDVEIAFYHFADIDKEESVVGLVERYGALPPTMTVTTGTVPNKRPHLYWRLEEPVMNMAEWSERQRGIAQALGGDMVIDPPRIMRLGGTVNFPTQKKMGKGYKVELTALRTAFANERADVTPETVAQAYPVRGAQNDINAPTPDSSGGIATLQQPGRVNVAQAIANCREGRNWRDNARSLTAHWAAIGWSTVEILAMSDHLTIAGYTVEETRADLWKLTNSARVKYGNPEPAEAILADPDAEPEVYQTLSLDELENLPPPTFLIDELLPEHGLTIVYGEPGAGKSFIVLDMALRIAHGMDWHGSAAKQIGVLYIAGEGRHGLGKRVKGWRREHAVEGANAPFKLLPIAVHMLDTPSLGKLKRTIAAVAQEVGFQIGLVIIDTVSRSIAGQDENKQEAMSLFVDGCADIQNFTNGAVIGVHHSGKDSSRGMRGSTVLLGGCDTSLRITKDEQQRAKIEVEKQKDAEEAAPIYMEMKKVEWVAGLGKEESTLVPTRSEPPVVVAGKIELNKEHRTALLREIAAAWMRKKPWSPYHQAKTTGRYLPAWMADRFSMKQADAAQLLSDWQMHEIIGMEIYNSDTKAAGLKVLRHPEDWK